MVLGPGITGGRYEGIRFRAYPLDDTKRQDTSIGNKDAFAEPWRGLCDWALVGLGGCLGSIAKGS